MKIQWEKYFDRIFCIFHLPYKNRMPRLQDEFERVGLLESKVFEWHFTTHNRYNKVVWDSIKNHKLIAQPEYANQAMALMDILKQSAALGYKRILVLEDDVAFLKDLTQLEKTLAAIPQNYDIVQLDKCFGEWRIKEWENQKKEKINLYFADCTGHWFGASTANVYQGDAIKKLGEALDKELVGCDQLCNIIPCKYAVCIKQPCIQVFYSHNCTSNDSRKLDCHGLYESQGIDYSDYNVPKGYSKNSLYTPDLQESTIRQSSNVNGMYKLSVSNKFTFDYIGVVCYTGYKDRVDELIPELERVGILDKVHFHWDFPSVFRDILFQATPKTAFCAEGGCFHMAVAHYNVIKTAYELGCQNILVMEDDVRFLKDPLLIDSILGTIPSDYDMLMFDRSKPSDIPLEEFKQHLSKSFNTNWRIFTSGTSTGCYAMSRRAMGHFIEIIERVVKTKDKLANPDAYFQKKRWDKVFWDDSFCRYFCYPSLAVQCIAGKGGSHCSMTTYWENNEYIGLKQTEYNIMLPIVTRNNFLTLLYSLIDKQEKKERIGKYRCPQRYRKSICCANKANDCIQSKEEKATKIFIWGNGRCNDNPELLQYAYRDNAQVILTEDGFIRSYDTWCGSMPDTYKISYSLLFDTSGYYFDATRTSKLEMLLNDFNLLVSPQQRVEARRLIDKIVSNKISKYNHQPIYTPKIGRPNTRKVLVVDQSYGDFSIKRGMADDSTFAKMLNAAISENPDADILVKTHPDTIAGKKGEKKGYYQDLKEHDNIYKVTFPINPYSLMEICDKVYVVSSQFGLEALMANKEVHTFGMPFYAGWGLTIDDQHLERRTNMRTLEELFYIFYCMYTHWVDPDKGCETTIDAVIDKMIELRKQVQNNPLLANKSSASKSYSGRPIQGATSVKTKHLWNNSSVVGNTRHSRGFVGRSSDKGWNW